MTTIFTPEKAAELSNQIDRQLQELKTQPYSPTKLPETPPGFPVKQSQAIEEVTQEKPERFLQKFGRAAKSDLCEEGGLLNSQWKKWGDLNNTDVVDKFGVLLVAMGFSGAALEILVVAIAVTVIHIGIKAFCEDYSQ